MIQGKGLYLTLAEYENDINKGAKRVDDIAVQNDIDQLALFIQNVDRVFQPCVLDDVVWSTERKGAPGKLTFKVLKDEVLDFAEGNIVTVLHNGKNLFKGYVFAKRRNKDGVISVTAYDQLRYLKNKEIYILNDFKASDLIRALAEDFMLKVGEIEDTGYVIPKYRGSNETLFDIIQFALDHTLLYSKPKKGQEDMKQFYILYDDFGKITLKHIKNMQLDILIDAETAEDFEYESSIDRGTYNKIKLYYDNTETKKRETYYELDSANIARWGVLQLTESFNPKQTKNPIDKVIKMLTLYNSVRRSLSIKNAIGDDRVRAGSIIFVHLNLGDMLLGSDKNGKLSVVPMMVESAQHRFSNNQHTMDLALRGNIFQ